MKALIIGASGATGKDLVNMLIQDPSYTEVVSFVRRPGNITHPKLSEVITDFNNIDGVSEFIKGDVWFSCLGTTLKEAGSRDNQWRIDYEIPLRFAQTARQNGVKTTVLISAYGAKPTSILFYSRMKGQLEKQIGFLAFDRYVVFKPGMLLRKDTDRSGERMSAVVINLLNRLGLIMKFKPLPTSVLAEKMVKAPKALPAGTHVIELDKVWDF